MDAKATITLTLAVRICGRYASEQDALDDLKKEVEILLKNNLNHLSEEFILEKTEYEVYE